MIHKKLIGITFAVVAMTYNNASAGGLFGRLTSRARSAYAVRCFAFATAVGTTAVGATIPSEKRLCWEDLGKKPYQTILGKRWTTQDGEYECPDEIILQTRHGGRISWKTSTGNVSSPENITYKEIDESSGKASIACPPNSDVSIDRAWGSDSLGFTSADRLLAQEDNNVVSYLTFSSKGDYEIYSKSECPEYSAPRRYLIARAYGDVIDISLKYPSYLQRLKNWYYNTIPSPRGKLCILSDKNPIPMHYEARLIQEQKRQHTILDRF